MKFLIVGPSWVGDAVMAQTLYKILKKDDQDHRIEVLSPDWSLPLLERMKEVSRSIPSPFKHGELKLKTRFNLGKELRQENYDRSIIMTNSLKSSLIPFFAKIPVRTSWLGELRFGFINDLRPKEIDSHPLMIEQFAKLGLNSIEEIKKPLPYPSLKIDLKNLEVQIQKLKIDVSKPSLAICPGAEFGPAKKWPSNYYAEVCNEFLFKDWNVLVFGSINDVLTGSKIESSINHQYSEGFFNLVGKTSLLDAIDLISYCKKAVTNDSGLMHIAAAVGTPLVALYGPSSPAYTPPLTDNKKILRKMEGYEKKREGDLERGYHQSLMAIKPTEVINALEELQKL